MSTIDAILLLGGGIIVLASLIVVHVLPTGLSAVRDPVSRYGITRFRPFYWIAAAGAALGGVGGALLFGSSSTGIAAAVLLWIFAAARVLIPFLPMDAPETPRTPRGRLHNLLAIVAFATITGAAFVGAGTLHDTGHPALSTITTVMAVIMAIGAVGVILAMFTGLRRAFGLFERLIYLGFIAWFISLGIGMLAV